MARQHSAPNATVPAPGEIPADFTYRNEPSQPIPVTPRRGHALPQATQPSWGLWPLGYQPARITSWLSTADTWQPIDSNHGHPYFAVHKPGPYPPATWPMRLSVIVPTHTMERHLGYQDADLHRRTQPSTPINAHPNWVDVSTGQAVDRSARSHLTVPGVAVYTVELHSDEELRAALAVHDAIMRGNPEPYMLQAALQRRTD